MTERFTDIEILDNVLYVRIDGETRIISENKLEEMLNEQHETIQQLQNIINCLEKGSCRSIDSFLDSYCSDELLKEFDLE